jgi:hypothetical protein
MTKEQLEWILDKGIDCNQMTLLLLYPDLPEHIKVSGWKVLLEKNGFIADNTLTQKADVYISEYSSLIEKGVKDSFSVDNWCKEIHTNIKTLLVTLTGKEQVRASIRDKSYSFLCNEKDFTKRMKDFLKKYNIKDFVKLEKVIYMYVRSCHKQKSWFPLMEYYIIKDGYSKLATDYDSFVEIVEVEDDTKLANVENMF